MTAATAARLSVVMSAAFMLSSCGGPGEQSARPGAPPGSQAARHENLSSPSPSLAVLPFERLSNGPDDDYLALGVVAELGRVVAAAAPFAVIGRASAFRSDPGQDARSLASALGADYFVTGSLAREHGRLKIDYRLSTVDPGGPMLEKSIDVPTSALGESIAGMAGQVIEAIAPGGAEPSAVLPGTIVGEPAALIAFERGMEQRASAYRNGPLLPGLQRADHWFRQAESLAAKFPEAIEYRQDLYERLALAGASDELVASVDAAAVDAAPARMLDTAAAAHRQARSPDAQLWSEIDLRIASGQLAGIIPLVETGLDIGCRSARWSHLLAAPFGYADSLVETFGRRMACDPLVARHYAEWVQATAWAGLPGPVGSPGQAFESSPDRALIDPVRVALHVAQGELRRADEIAVGIGRQDARAWSMAMVQAARGDLQVAGRLQSEFLIQHGPSERYSTVFAAWLGDRGTANRFASRIDGRRAGHFALLQTIWMCLCGAPFDLEATPNFARMLSGAGLTWPPASPADFPLKGW